MKNRKIEHDDKRDRGIDIESSLLEAAYKLHGIAGLLFKESPGEGIDLSEKQANGLYYLLDQIADDIKKEADNVAEVTR